jgi:hypothetical protein
MNRVLIDIGPKFKIALNFLGFQHYTNLTGG